MTNDSNLISLELKPFYAASEEQMFFFFKVIVISTGHETIPSRKLHD